MLPIVIDCGSGMCKAGFASDAFPRSVFSSIIYQNGKDTFIGDRDRCKDCHLEVKYPVYRGIVTNWDDMENVLRYIFQNELGVDQKQYPVMLTEIPHNPITDREKLTQIMFETFNVPCMYVANQAVLALYASGRTMGVVLDSGDGVTHAISVYKDYALPEAIIRVDLAGRDLTDNLVSSLNVKPEIAHEIKEHLCYVSYDFENEVIQNRHALISCRLPDGNIIDVGQERFRCPETLYRPELLGLQYKGIHETIFDSIMSCDEAIRRQLCFNVVLSGGSTMFPGMPERMKKELITMVPPLTRVRIADPSMRKYSSWIGGTVLTSLPEFRQMWITRQDYEEAGPSIVHWKCL